MNPRLSSLGLALVLCAGAGGAFAQPVDAAARCESELRETIRRMRGPQAQDVVFIGSQRTLAPTADGNLGVKGEGRYRGPGGSVPFTYSCAVDADSGEASGVLFRETDRLHAAAPEPSWQPDLTRFSPEPCEAAIAATLSERYPRVGRITFDAGARQLRPAPNDHTRLDGRGAVQRARGMNAEPFSFACEFETRSGKVVRVSTSG